jgi:hypothetical protein
MNPCIKIWFYTPLQLIVYAAGILAAGAGMMALIVIC